jgi:predicted phage terminase large subunit-like protein
MLQAAVLEMQKRGLILNGQADKKQEAPEPDWRVWLARYFPDVCTAPFAERHLRLWEWFESLAPGARVRARVEVWPRGGAKSSTAELGCARVCVKKTRRYALYVSQTQEQADKHVQAIASHLEVLGVMRALNIYGSSKGWRRQELRAEDGFNVSAYGLDTAARGVKLDQYRPDLILFDDIDNQNDSARTIEKKIAAITTAILPAGSNDAAVLFLQNKIHEESIVATLCDGRADFLHGREPAFVEPAVLGLEVMTVAREDGANEYHITAGQPTWEGQSLAVCQGQINDWGLRAFKREAQHEVEGGSGYVFNVAQLLSVPPDQVPPLTSVCLAWDLAATEGGGDHTVGVLMGVTQERRYYVLTVLRGQWGSERVRACIELASKTFAFRYPDFSLRLPQDPGQAGKAQKDQLRKQLADFTPAILPVSGSKVTRATGLAEAVNLGNVFLVEQEIDSIFAPYLETRSFFAWHKAFREELRKFREDVEDQVDDTVDAASDSFNRLSTKYKARMG